MQSRGFLQCALVTHISCEDSDKLVAVKDSAVFINGKAAVSVTVKCNANVTFIFDNEFLKRFKESRAAAFVDICTRRFVIEHKNRCAESREKLLCGSACRTVRTVNGNSYSAEVVVNGLHNASYVVPFSVFVV